MAQYNLGKSYVVKVKTALFLKYPEETPFLKIQLSFS